MLFNIYIDGLRDILYNSTIGGSFGRIRVNHMLYADDLCIISLSSAGLENSMHKPICYCETLDIVL